MVQPKGKYFGFYIQELELRNKALAMREFVPTCTNKRGRRKLNKVIKDKNQPTLF